MITITNEKSINCKLTPSKYLTTKMEKFMSTRGHKIRKTIKTYLKGNTENHFDDIQFIHVDSELYLH